MKTQIITKLQYDTSSIHLYLAVDERQYEYNERRTFKPFIAVWTAVTGSSVVGIFVVRIMREEKASYRFDDTSGTTD